MKNTIVINATATKTGGALTILSEYINEIGESKNRYYIFCGAENIYSNNSSISIIRIKTNGIGLNGIKRIYWDFLGLFVYCKLKKINPDLIISFQNTGVFFPKKKQLIYYHQPIPLFEYNWNILNREELIFSFYKNIYPFFIKLFLRQNTYFVVQLNFIKELFINKFNVDRNKVHVINPNLNLNKKSLNQSIRFNDNCFHIFYPTSLAKYKNIDVLLDALAILKKENFDVFSNIKLHLTVQINNKKIINQLSQKGIASAVNITGLLSREKVMAYYNTVDLMVFPSYIETFGLPLIEAASFGLPIISSDLEFTREVLREYSGVFFVSYNNPREWSNQIINSFKKGYRFKPLECNSEYNSWEKFKELSNSIINENV